MSDKAKGLEKAKGFLDRGADVPQVQPWEVIIVGGPDPEIDVPYTAKHWYLFCPRAAEPVEEEFVNSIRIPNTIYEPITVIRIDDRYYAVTGRRRIKACRQIWKEQEAEGKPPKARVHLRVIQHYRRTAEQIWATNVDENLTKKSLSQVQRAAQVAHFMNEYATYNPYTDVYETACQVFRCSRADLDIKIAINRLSPRAQHALETSVISTACALDLVKLDSDQQKQFIQKCQAEGIKGRATVALAKRVKAKKPTDAIHTRTRTVLEKTQQRLLKQFPEANQLKEIPTDTYEAAILIQAIEWALGGPKLLNEKLTALVADLDKKKIDKKDETE